MRVLGGLLLRNANTSGMSDFLVVWTDFGPDTCSDQILDFDFGPELEFEIIYMYERCPDPLWAIPSSFRRVHHFGFHWELAFLFFTFKNRFPLFWLTNTRASRVQNSTLSLLAETTRRTSGRLLAICDQSSYCSFRIIVENSHTAAVNTQHCREAVMDD